MTDACAQARRNEIAVRLIVGWLALMVAGSLGMIGGVGCQASGEVDGKTGGVKVEGNE